MIDLNDHNRLMRFYRPKALNVRMRVYCMKTDAATLLPAKKMVQRFNLYFTRMGKLKEIVDAQPTLHQWIFAYNKQHQLTRKTLYTDEQIVTTEVFYKYNAADELFHTQTFDYSQDEPKERLHFFIQPDNDVHEIVCEPSNETFGIYNTHKIEHDHFGREIKRMVYGSDDAFLNGYALFYDRKGRLKERFNLNSEGLAMNQLSFKYNNKGDREQKIERHPKETITHQYVYTYDDMGYWNEMHHLKNGELKWIFERQIFFYQNSV